MCLLKKCFSCFLNYDLSKYAIQLTIYIYIKNVFFEPTLLRWLPCRQLLFIDGHAAFCIVQAFQLVMQTLEIRPSVFGMWGMFFSRLQEKWPAEPTTPLQKKTTKKKPHGQSENGSRTCDEKARQKFFVNKNHVRQLS